MAHSVDYSLQRAKNKLRKGHIEEAEKAFQSILVAFPGNVRAQNGLTSCAQMRQRGPDTQQIAASSTVIDQYYAAGQHDEVIRLSDELLKTHPDNAAVLLKCGASYGMLGEFDKARTCFDKVIILQPHDPAPYNNIGTLYKMGNDVSTAMQFYAQAISRDAKHFDSLKNMAFCYENIGQYEEASRYMAEALKIKPDNFELHNHLGSLFSKLKDTEKAEACYKRAVELKPDFNAALNNLGNIHYGRQEYERAIALYERAIANDPLYGDACNNLANVLKDMGYLDEAIINYEKAIEMQPQKAELYSNYSVVLKDKYDLERAQVAVEKAIALKENFDDAYWNKALIQLSGKNFKEGWKNYEWRWKATNFDSVYLSTNQPRWDGKKERVLIWGEQGIGDQIMFSTLFEEFAEFCALPIFQVDSRLLPIFRRTFPQFHFIPGDKKLAENEYDSHIPMGSLPQYLRNSEQDFAQASPTRLMADDVSSKKIRQAFRIGDKCLVGISWRSMNKSTGWMRSLSLTEFLQPFKGQDVEIVNLQYGDCKQEIDEAYQKTGIAVKSVNEIDTFTNIDHLASLINSCDRVITIDNSTVHLAASMGKPTDLLLPFITDWRWCGGEKMPMWYDCLTVHRAPYGVHLKDCIGELVGECFKQ